MQVNLKLYCTFFDILGVSVFPCVSPLMLDTFSSPLQGLMINTRKKILKEKGATPTSLEEEVAKALFDIEVSPSCDFKAELREIYLSGATEIEVGKGGAAVIVHIPFRAWKFAKKIQSRLIKELEKKFSRKHVILVANRTILDKDFRRKGMKVRPRSRTLTAVHEAILEDVVGPTEIVGKRTRIGTDGSKILKILLDPRDKDTPESLRWWDIHKDKSTSLWLKFIKI